jgi:hypothetical protein
MSFLDFDLNDVPALDVVPAGEEYKLRITSCEMKISSKGNPGIQVRLDIPSAPASKDISHWINLPDASTDEKKKIRQLNQVKEFCLCFGLDLSRPEFGDNLVGSTGWALLDVEEDDTYGEQNRVKRFITAK